VSSESKDQLQLQMLRLSQLIDDVTDQRIYAALKSIFTVLTHMQQQEGMP